MAGPVEMLRLRPQEAPLLVADDAEIQAGRRQLGEHRPRARHFAQPLQMGGFEAVVVDSLRFLPAVPEYPGKAVPCRGAHPDLVFSQENGRTASRERVGKEVKNT